MRLKIDIFSYKFNKPLFFRLLALPFKIPSQIFITSRAVYVIGEASDIVHLFYARQLIRLVLLLQQFLLMESR